MIPKARWVCIILVLVLLFLIVLSWKYGTVNLTWGAFLAQIGKVIAGERPDTLSMEAIILWELRLPRILLAVGIGAALAISGLGFQAVLGNTLADPYLLGVSAGASLGATLIIAGKFSAGWVPFAAFVGAIVVVTVVLALARTDGGYPPDRLILSGVAISAILTAAVSGLLILSRERLTEAYFWLLGGFSGRGWREVHLFFIHAVAGGIALFGLSKQLNIMTLGDEAATNLGLPVHRFKLWVLILGSLLASAAVSVAGIIGFVGLIVPHVAKMIVGPDHRGALPAAALGGAILLLGADTLARMGPAELPVGIITAFLGGPFFLWQLRKGRYGEGG